MSKRVIPNLQFNINGDGEPDYSIIGENEIIQDIVYSQTVTGIREAIKRKAKANRHPTEIVAQLKYLLAVAKTRANRAGIKFNMSLDEALHIYYSQDGKCAYSKKTFTMGIPNCPFKMSPDQIIPGGGYTKENVQFVTSTINKMKLNLTPIVFVQVITDIYKNLNSN